MHGGKARVFPTPVFNDPFELVTLRFSKWSLGPKDVKTTCRRATATICTRPGPQRKRAAAALSQARSANTRHPAGRPHTPPADRMYATLADKRQTDRRQTASSLNAPGWGHKITFTFLYS